MQSGPRLLFAAVMVAGAAADAQPADPILIAGEPWQHQTQTGSDKFTRRDGTVVDLTVAPTSCSKLTRTAEAARYGWVPRVYWPKLDTAGGKVTLCFEHAGGTALVAVTPAAGKAVSGDVAGLLDAIATQLRPPTELAMIGRIHPSLPIAMIQKNTLAFVIDGQAATIGLSFGDEGTCAFENARVIMSLGKFANRPFADGYWPTVSDSKDGTAVMGCLDLREGYITMIVTPPSQVAAFSDVLEEIRRAAYAQHGGPLTTEIDPVVLPHTEQRVSARSNAGLWKVVDGKRFGRAGADVFVSIATLGLGSTMYSVAVSEGPCATGTTPLASDVASTLFPSQLGAVWSDADPFKLRWQAWTCVTQGTTTATIAVVSAIAETNPPKLTDAAMLRALVERIARSYGVVVPEAAPPQVVTPYTPPPVGGGYRSSRGAYFAAGGGYGGVISLAPETGDRRTGVMFGLDGRIASDSLGGVLAMSLEVGYGGGEVIGGLRIGGGVAIGPLQAVLGVGMGSIGPGAALDGYAELSLSLKHGLLWIGAHRAKGLDGPGHDQLELKIVVPGKDQTGVYLGARAMWFGVDEDTMLETGSAVLITIGAGGAGSSDD